MLFFNNQKVDTWTFLDNCIPGAIYKVYVEFISNGFTIINNLTDYYEIISKESSLNPNMIPNYKVKYLRTGFITVANLHIITTFDDDMTILLYEPGSLITI